MQSQPVKVITHDTVKPSIKETLLKVGSGIVRLVRIRVCSLILVSTMLHSLSRRIELVCAPDQPENQVIQERHTDEVQALCPTVMDDWGSQVVSTDSKLSQTSAECIGLFYLFSGNCVEIGLAKHTLIQSKTIHFILRRFNLQQFFHCAVMSRFGVGLRQLQLKKCIRSDI